jgi:hypothetical protein
MSWPTKSLENINWKKMKKWEIIGLKTNCLIKNVLENRWSVDIAQKRSAFVPILLKSNSQCAIL